MIFVSGSRTNKIRMSHDGHVAGAGSSSSTHLEPSGDSFQTEFSIPLPPAIVSVMAGLDGTPSLRATAEGHGGTLMPELAHVTIPSSVVVGDLLVLCVALDGDVTAPVVSGWTEELAESDKALHYVGDAGDNYATKVALYWRVAVSGDAGSSLPDFGGTAWTAQLRCYAGATFLGGVARSASSAGDPEVRTPVPGGWHRRTANFITGATGAIVLSPVVQGSFIYWFNWKSTSADCSIGRANLDGTGVNNSFITGISRNRGGLEGQGCLMVDSSHIYWTEVNAIARANLDGSSVNRTFIDLSSSGGQPAAITRNTAHIYWTDRVIQKIGQANVDGSSPNAGWYDFDPSHVGLPKLMELAADDNFVWYGDALASRVVLLDLSHDYSTFGYDLGGPPNDRPTQMTMVGTELLTALRKAPRILDFDVSDVSGIPALAAHSGGPGYLALPDADPIGVAADATYFYYGVGNTIARIERVSSVDFFAQFFVVRTTGEFSLSLSSGASDELLTGRRSTSDGELLRMASEDFHSLPPLSGGHLAITPDLGAITDGETAVITFNAEDGQWAEAAVTIEPHPDVRSHAKIVVVNSATGQGGVMIGNF